MTVLRILYGAGLTLAACFSAGFLVLRALRLEFHRQEQRLFAFVTGAACVSLLMFVLAAVHLVTRGVLQALAAALVIAAVWKRGPERKALPPLPRPWLVLFAAVFTTFTWLYFFNALAPEVSPDGSSYHLGNVLRYYEARGFVRIPTDMYANLSQGLELLFLYAFSFGRHSAAAMVHFAFLLALPALMLCYARRFGSPAAGVFGALLVYASPVIGIDGVSAYNDVAAACILFAVFYLLQIWDEVRDSKLFLPIGLLAGFAFAIKYTAFLAVPYAVLFVAWKGKLRLRAAATVAGCALLAMAPWLIKNWLWMDNPFSPFLNGVFPNRYITVHFEREYSHLMQYFSGLESRWRIPLETTVHGGRLGGVLGPVFLLAPLGALACRKSAGRRLFSPPACLRSLFLAMRRRAF